MNQVERVRRKFPNYADFVLKIDHESYGYGPVILKLDFQSLADRRVLANRTFLLKLIDGFIDCPELL